MKQDFCRTLAGHTHTHTHTTYCTNHMHVYMCIYTNASSFTLLSFPSGVEIGVFYMHILLFMVNIHHFLSSSPHFWRTKNGIQYKALENFGLLGNLFFFVFCDLVLVHRYGTAFSPSVAERTKEIRDEREERKRFSCIIITIYP